MRGGEHENTTPGRCKEKHAQQDQVVVIFIVIYGRFYSVTL